MSEIRAKERQSFLAWFHEGACGGTWQAGQATDRGGLVETLAAGKKATLQEPAGGPAADASFSDGGTQSTKRTGISLPTVISKL